MVDSARSYGREWELAQGELCRLVEYRCPLDMLDCVKACVRLVALSVEASLARRYVRPWCLMRTDEKGRVMCRRFGRGEGKNSERRLTCVRRVRVDCFEEGFRVEDAVDGGVRARPALPSVLAGLSGYGHLTSSGIAKVDDQPQGGSMT